MRCLVLADALADRGASCRFLVNPEAVSTVPSLRTSRHAVETAPADPADYPAAAVTVFDLYEAGATVHRRARERAPLVVVIDDLANRRLDADMVVDFTFGRSEIAYGPLVEPGTPVYMGPSYALLRPEFYRNRSGSLARRATIVRPRRLFVSFGLTDFGGLTLPAMSAGQEAGLQVDVAIGSSAPMLAEVIRQADPARTRVHVDGTAVADLMRAADLAVGAGGTTSWERCCLGLPCLMATVADNQLDLAVALQAAGAVELLPRGAEPEAIRLGIARAVAGGYDLPAMSSAGQALCDGRGADVIADHILALVRSRCSWSKDRST